MTVQRALSEHRQGLNSGAGWKHVGDGSGVVVQLADLAVRKVDDLARAWRKRVDALLRTAKRIKLSNTGTSESIQSHRQ